jgi:dolichol-phosphate mannosyltransferase
MHTGQQRLEAHSVNELTMSGGYAGGGHRAIGMPELSIIIPAFNERENVEPLLAVLIDALADIAWEAIFVDDDSPDGTASYVRSLARDERLLPQMLKELRCGDLDIVIGSRYMAGGGIGDWHRGRVRISGLATRFARLICKADVTDPLSGFFMCRREVFEQAVRQMSAQGFKVLLDLLASSPQPLRVSELPYSFRERRHGESKLDTLIVWEYGMLLADKLIGHIVPVRFALFALIGGLGLVIHLITLWVCLNLFSAEFRMAQTAATVSAMTSNFFLNNHFTYRDQRLHGFDLLRGLGIFYLICGLGAIANVGVASYVFAADRAWWLAGIAGAIVGSVWNFAMSSVFTWKRR